MRGLQKKWLLRRALRPLLPPEVVDGRKRGFSMPAARWLRHDARELVLDALSPARRPPPGRCSTPAVVDGLVRGPPRRARGRVPARCGAWWSSRCGTSGCCAADSRPCRRSHEGLGRPHRAGPRAGLPPDHLAPAGRRPRGRGHRARLRPDAAAGRAARPRVRADRPPRRALGVRQGPRSGRPLGVDRALGPGPRLRRVDGPRLERPADRVAGARHPGGRHVRLRVRDAAAHARLAPGEARAGARGDPRRAAAPGSARSRRS